MPTITDYKVITYDFNSPNVDRSLKEAYEGLKQFNEAVGNYLKKGYSLHGPTINSGTNYINHRFSQAVVKYSAPQFGPAVEDYYIVYMACSQYENHDIYMRGFEHNIMDMVRDGWILRGDLQYCQYEDRRSGHHYSQTLIKYKSAEPNLLGV